MPIVIIDPVDDAQIVTTINKRHKERLVALCAAVTTPGNSYLLNPETHKAISDFSSMIDQTETFIEGNLNLSKDGITSDYLERQKPNNEDYFTGIDGKAQKFQTLCERLIQGGYKGAAWGNATLLRPNARLAMLDFFKFYSLKLTIDAVRNHIVSRINVLAPENHYSVDDSHTFTQQNPDAVEPYRANDSFYNDATSQKIIQSIDPKSDGSVLQKLLDGDPFTEKLKTAATVFQKNGGQLPGVDDQSNLYQNVINVPLKQIQCFKKDEAKLKKVSEVIASSKLFFAAADKLLKLVESNNGTDNQHKMLWFISFIAKSTADSQSPCFENSLLDATDTQTSTFGGNCNKIHSIKLILGNTEYSANQHPYFIQISHIIKSFKNRCQALKTNMLTNIEGYNEDDFSQTQTNAKYLKQPIESLFTGEQDPEIVKEGTLEIAGKIHFATTVSNRDMIDLGHPASDLTDADLQKKLTLRDKTRHKDAELKLARTESVQKHFGTFFNHVTSAKKHFKDYRKKINELN